MGGDNLRKNYKYEMIIKDIKSPLEIIISLILLILVCIGTSILFSEYTSEKLYHDELLNIYDDMARVGAETNKIANVYNKVWSKGITRNVTTKQYANLIGVQESTFIEKIAVASKLKDNKTYEEDLGKIIEYVNVFYSKNGEIDAIKNKLDKLDKKLKKLNNPPEEYREAYYIAIEMYYDLNVFCNNAISPEGSLNSYKQQINDGNERLGNYYDKLRLIMPK